jgi:hypothetical protein
MNMKTLDVAFKITKDLGTTRHLEIKNKLQEKYPELTWDEIVEHYSLSLNLLSKAAELGFKHRDNKINESQAKKTLKILCPGFSNESYDKAWAHGLYVSVW